MRQIAPAAGRGAENKHKLKELGANIARQGKMLAYAAKRVIAFTARSAYCGCFQGWGIRNKRALWKQLQARG